MLGKVRELKHICSMRKAVVHFCGDVNISIARIHMGDGMCSTRVSPKNQNVKFHSFHPLKHNHFAYNATTKSFKILSHVLLSELGANVSIGEYKGKKWQNINFRGFSYLRILDPPPPFKKCAKLKKL